MAAPAEPNGRGVTRARMTGKERREQLLQVGRRLFAEKGFEGTSVEEIAAKAGVSKPVVYEHFGGKEGLYALSPSRRRWRCWSTSRPTATASGSWSATPRSRSPPARSPA